MTVSGTTYKNSYTLDSSTTVFPYTFKITASADMLVQLYNTTTYALTTVSSADYTVAGAGLDTGTRTVTYAGAASYGTTYQLILSSNADYTQPTDYVDGDEFSEETHELALDRLCIEIRQVKEAVDRAIKVAQNVSNPTDMTSIGTGYLYTDGTNWSITDITTISTTYAATLDRGADASKSSTPSAGDIYIATDTGITYTCYVANTWTPNYTIQLAASATLTVKNSAGTTLATIDSNGNLKIKGNLTTQGTF